VFLVAEFYCFSSYGLLLSQTCSVRRDAMPAHGPRYSRDQLLSLYTPAEPSHTVLQRLCLLGLRTVCSLSVLRRCGSFCLRRYRGHRAGRQRRVAPTLRPCGNGAFVVSASRSKRRLISCSRPRTFVDVRRSQSADASVGRLSFGFINICSLANKVDDLLQV